MKNLYKIEDELYIVDNTKDVNKDTKTCWCMDISCNELVLYQGVFHSYHYKHYKKIIMTTDKSINVLCSCSKDCGAKESDIQSIDDEFLEWFVKNPSCEVVEVEESTLLNTSRTYLNIDKYKLIIPKEEPKPHSFCEIPEKKCTMNYCDENGCMNRKRILVEPKHETVEEAAEINCESITHPYCDREKAMFIKGAKWQQEQDKNKYSEEEVFKLLKEFNKQKLKLGNNFNVKEWFEQFKKK